MLIDIVRRALLGTIVALSIAVSLSGGSASAGSLDVVASFTAKTSQLTSRPIPIRIKSRRRSGCWAFPTATQSPSLPTSGNP
jgi:hypothetical protein